MWIKAEIWSAMPNLRNDNFGTCLFARQDFRVVLYSAGSSFIVLRPGRHCIFSSFYSGFWTIFGLY